MRKQQPLSPYVICWSSFSSDVPRLRTLVRRGDRLLSDDPVVKAHPGYFVADDGAPLPNPELRAAEMAAEMAAER